jgi:FRG domain
MEFIPEFLNNISGHEKIIYRGHANNEWELTPSIGRHLTGPWTKQALNFEMKSLEEFKKRSIPYLKVTPKADIEWLCLMQHHGCATRLIDFTKNPLIALFFASDPSQATDGEVIIGKYGRSYESVSDEKLFERSNSFAYYPPHITERIVGQSGCFVYVNKPNTPLSGKQIDTIKVLNKNKYIIRKELKELGISHSSLFPGIDGVCQDLNDNLIWNLELEELLPF